MWNMKKQKIAIIGGGLTGLVAGYELAKKGHKITIFEKEKELGGLAGCFKLKGKYYLEKTYHHIFESDKEIINLIKELGLQNRLVWRKDSTAIYSNGKIQSFVGPIDLLKFKGLDLIDKLRLGLVGLYLQRENNWQQFIGIPAYKWMEKWCGKRAYKVIWEPLLKGKFGEEYKQISMAWMWARIHTRGISKKLGYLEGSLQTVFDELERKIKRKGGVVKRETAANKKEIVKEFDKVISTGPSGEIKYIGAITVVFTSKQNLSKYYWHNINDSQSPFLAFIQHSNFIDTYGENVYYLGCYLPHDNKYFSASDTSVYRDFFDYLKNIFPDFDEKQITYKNVFRLKNAQHLVTCDYKMPQKKEGNLYTVNFARIFPEDRGVNFAVKEGKKIAKEITLL